MSDLFVDNIKHQSSQGSGTITLGASGETIQAASGSTNNLGVSEIDMWYLTSDFSFGADTATHVNSGWTRWGEAGFTKKGTGMTESSGTFSFPSTGYYEILTSAYMNSTSSASQYMGVLMYATEDNSTYTNRYSNFDSTSANNYYASPNQGFYHKVSDITQDKIRMYGYSKTAAKFDGNSSSNFRSGLIFKRIADI